MTPQCSNPLEKEFEIATAVETDLDHMMELVTLGWKTDGIWSVLVKDATTLEEMELLRSMFAPRFQKGSGLETFKVVQKSTGKLVAWTGLRYPKTNLDPPSSPILPAALNMDLWKQFGMAIASVRAPPTDPTRDFTRAGTMVHPDFQRRGIATWMTDHCNVIADEWELDGRKGARTCVGARPSSFKMFANTGFVDVPEREIVFDMDDFGGGGVETIRFLMRDPKGGRIE